MAITWLADVLRAAGLTVVEHAGWKTRTVGGSWSPQFGIVHATAAPDSQSDTDQIRIVRDGRSDLDGPIANACVDRAGRWHVLAAGRCNTTLAGTAGPYAGMGNTYALGVEACNDNRGGAWPDVQYRAYVRGWAAIARRMTWEPERLRGHKEHTPGHKTDPTFSMDGFRANVARVLAGEDDDEMTPEQLKLLTDTAWQVRNVPSIAGGREVLTGAAGKLVERMLDTEERMLVAEKKLAELAPASSLTPEQWAEVVARAEAEAREEVAQLRADLAALGDDQPQG